MRRTIFILALACSPVLATTWDVRTSPCTASGGGITDDRTAIQNCMNLAVAGDTVSFTAGRIFFVSGLLTMKSGITYTGNSSAIVKGFGGTTAGAYPILQIFGGSNISILNITLDGGGVDFEGNSTNITFSGNTVRNLLGAPASQQANVALYFAGYTNVANITGNTFFNILPGGRSDCHDATPNPCPFTDGFSNAIIVPRPNKVVIKNNTFDTVDEAIAFREDHTQETRDGNQISFNTFTGIHRMPIEIQTWFLTNTVISFNWMHNYLNPYWQSYGISYAAGYRDKMARTTSLTNNYYDAANTGTSQCVELYGINTVEDTDYCVSTNSSGWGGGIETAPWNSVNEVCTGCVVDSTWVPIVKNTTLCGPWTTGKPMFTGEQAAGEPGGQINATQNNTVIASCAGVTKPANIGNIGGAPALAISKSHAGSFTIGATGAYSIVVSDVGGGPTSGTVTATDTLPTGLTVSSMGGSGWSCVTATATCTRSDALASGAAYPSITLTVNILGTAPASVTNQVGVSGGGSATGATASDATTIASPPPPPSNGPTAGVSEFFDSGPLNSALWSKTDPKQDCVISFGATGQTKYVQMSVPGGITHDLWVTNNACRIMQPLTNTDFVIVFKYANALTLDGQEAGFLIEESGTKFLRFDMRWDPAVNSPRVFAASINAGVGTILNDVPIAMPTHMRITRVGNVFNQDYSYDGVSWTNAVAIAFPMTVADAGLFVGNNGAAAPCAVQYDYFQFVRSGWAIPTTAQLEKGPVSVKGKAATGSVPASVCCTYYVDNAGNDSCDGTLPALGGSGQCAWKTVAKVNSAALAAGNSVGFKRSGVWRESLRVPSSGNATSPITFTAYGSGSHPILTGADVVSGMTLLSGTTYQKAGVATRAFVAIYTTGGISSVAQMGSSQGALNNHQWFWASNVFYFRDDSGNPSGNVQIGQRGAVVNLNAKSYVTLDGIDTQGGQANASQTVADPGGNISIASPSSNVRVVNARSDYSNLAGVFISGADFVTVDNYTVTDVIRGPFNPGDSILITPNENAANKQGTNNTVSNVTIGGWVGRDAVGLLGADGTNLTNITIAPSGGTAPAGGGSRAVNLEPEAGWTVDHTTVTNLNVTAWPIMDSSPISATNASAGVVQNLTINFGLINNGDLNGQNGITLHGVGGTNVINGLQITNVDFGLDIFSSNLTLKYSTISLSSTTASQMGVYIDGTSTVNMYYNTVIGGFRPWYSATPGADLVAYNNTFYNQQFGAKLNGHLTLKNNLFYKVSPAEYIETFSGSGVNAANYNLWFPNYNAGWRVVGVNNNFPQWQALGFDINGANLNPLFINAPSNLSLDTGSPALGTGTFIPGISTANPPNIGSK